LCLRHHLYTKDAHETRMHPLLASIYCPSTNSGWRYEVSNT
jgi:hypothetical protein